MLLGALVALVLAGPVAAGDGDGPQRPTVNRDRYDELAIGHPFEDVPHGINQRDAGAVTVLYGARNGFEDMTFQNWSQLNTDESQPGEYDWFGRALAMGDFDGDGDMDLAIGIPGEDVDGEDQAGAVHVLYAHEDRLDTSGDQFWHQDLPDVAGNAKEDDNFGAALAAADFNGDSYDDLAVGIPAYDVGTARDYGAVHILYGSASGLVIEGQRLWLQGSLYGLPDEPEEHDNFGHALGVGDFDCDGFEDLAIGVPYEDIESGTVLNNAGVVHVLYGASAGLSSARDQIFYQGSLNIPGVQAQADEQFGYALAGGDFDGNGCSDLAVGVINDRVGTVAAGAVNLIFSDGSGLSLAAPQHLTQDILSSAAPEGAESRDKFGFALAAGDFNGDGTDDLAVGAPNENVGSAVNAGAVNIIYGSFALADQMFQQPLNAGGSEPERDDCFGWALAAGDFDGNGAEDLAIGVPREHDDETGAEDSGLVHILYGTPGHQLSATGSQTLAGGTVEEFDLFGYSLAASGRFPTPWPIYLPLVVD
jgi:hypothetical protein